MVGRGHVLLLILNLALAYGCAERAARPDHAVGPPDATGSDGTRDEDAAPDALDAATDVVVDAPPVTADTQRPADLEPEDTPNTDADADVDVDAMDADTDAVEPIDAQEVDDVLARDTPPGAGPCPFPAPEGYG